MTIDIQEIDINEATYEDLLAYNERLSKVKFDVDGLSFKVWAKIIFHQQRRQYPHLFSESSIPAPSVSQPLAKTVTRTPTRTQRINRTRTPKKDFWTTLEEMSKRSKNG